MVDPRKAPFRFWSFFFSLQGRVSRTPILAFELPTRLGLLLATQWIRHVSGLGTSTRLLLDLPFSLVSLVVLWPNFSLLFKRFHDANLSGLWSLAYFTPSIYGAYVSYARIEAMRHNDLVAYRHVGLPHDFWILMAFNYGLILIALLLRGSRTANRYGPPPGNARIRSRTYSENRPGATCAGAWILPNRAP